MIGVFGLDDMRADSESILNWLSGHGGHALLFSSSDSRYQTANQGLMND